MKTKISPLLVRNSFIFAILTFIVVVNAFAVTGVSAHGDKTATRTPTKTTAPNYTLNLSHIACADGRVEIHFVLLNVPAGITPGRLTYTYGSINAGKHTGNVWHYTDTRNDGYYNVTSASVQVSGVTVNLHNPGAYSGNYSCAPTKTPTRTPASSATRTPTKTFTPTKTPTRIPA